MTHQKRHEICSRTVYQKTHRDVIKCKKTKLEVLKRYLEHNLLHGPNLSGRPSSQASDVLAN